MNPKPTKKIFFLAILMILLLITMFPARVLADRDGILQFPFGFQIKQKYNCICSGFNHLYIPARWGLPLPLPPSASGFGRFTGGAVATVPLGLPIPFYPIDTYEWDNLNTREWLLGMTHGSIPPPIVMPCVRLVMTWLGPRCRRSYGWLWRMIGSGWLPDYITPIW